MKVLFLFPVFFAATQFVPPVRAAEPAPLATAAPDAEIIKRHDSNQDGKLDEAEIAAVKEKVLVTGFEKRERRREKIKARHEAWLKEFDKNADGKLDDPEKSAMQTRIRARVEKTPRLLKQLDSD